VIFLQEAANCGEDIPFYPLSGIALGVFMCCIPKPSIISSNALDTTFLKHPELVKHQEIYYV